MSYRTEVVIAYDVESSKARNTLIKELKKLGLVRVQKSVFWGRLLPAERRNIGLIFKSLLDKETDQAFIVAGQLSEDIQKDSFGYIDFGVFKDEPYDVV